MIPYRVNWHTHYSFADDERQRIKKQVREEIFQIFWADYAICKSFVETTMDVDCTKINSAEARRRVGQAFGCVLF